MDRILSDYLERYPELRGCKESVVGAVGAIVNCYRSGGKLLVAGNGGSAADSAHICGELLKGFLLKRPLSGEDKSFYATQGEIGGLISDKLQGSLPAVDLSAMQSVISATLNDNGADLIFAQQINGLGKPGDVFIGISTSGNSRNVIAAGIVAKRRGLTAIALTGERESAMSSLFDITVRAPSSLTPRVQEFHLPIYHLICAAVEAELWKQ
ncbi:MAG: SIS domain-containing protein [Oscillospiraceae bacterium]|jgi:D-sedoheptulose 7-phosphate isomerase|nr:SIS domain-containing protein [Oscillospiraceae bacterium]